METKSALRTEIPFKSATLSYLIYPRYYHIYIIVIIATFRKLFKKSFKFSQFSIVHPYTIKIDLIILFQKLNTILLLHSFLNL